VEIEEAEKATVLVVADVIYSDDLSNLFFITLAMLMSRGSEKNNSYLKLFQVICKIFKMFIY
jgi:hypothetical protein